MIRNVSVPSSHLDDKGWVGFPGGELEGRRPRALCPACRIEQRTSPMLCFQCYRLELDRQRALQAAGDLNTASVERFQTTLPFEPVNVARLARLRAERASARAELRAGPERFADRRRHAQIAARHALQRIAAGLRERDDRERAWALADAAHAAELQLPDAWLPFVVAR